MSDILFNEIATPSTPAAGKVKLFTDNVDRYLRTLDSKGVQGQVGDHELFNYVRNSGFWFAQRQAPATLTTYSNVGGRILTADGWGISNENASTQFRRVDTTGAFETGLRNRFWGEYTKITANGKIIVTQVIEGSHAQALRGRTVRVQAWIKAIIGTPIAMKMALISWSGTVDTVPSGAGLFFTAHGANGVDPTLATNLSYLAPRSGVTPDNATAAANNISLSATTTWQRFGGVFDVPTTARNLIVAIWSDNQIVTTNGYALSQVSLTDGFEIQEWAPMDIPRELDRVRRFYQKTFTMDVAPAQNAGATTGALLTIIAKAAATALAANFYWRYAPEMRASPTVTLFNPGAANAQARRVSGAAAADQTATATANATAASVTITATGDAAGAVGDQVIVHASADAEL